MALLVLPLLGWVVFAGLLLGVVAFRHWRAPEPEAAVLARLDALHAGAVVGGTDLVDRIVVHQLLSVGRLHLSRVHGLGLPVSPEPPSLTLPSTPVADALVNALRARGGTARLPEATADPRYRRARDTHLATVDTLIGTQQLRRALAYTAAVALAAVVLYGIAVLAVWGENLAAYLLWLFATFAVAVAVPLAAAVLLPGRITLTVPFWLAAWAEERLAHDDFRRDLDSRVPKDVATWGAP